MSSSISSLLLPLVMCVILSAVTISAESMDREQVQFRVSRAPNRMGRFRFNGGKSKIRSNFKIFLIKKVVFLQSVRIPVFTLQDLESDLLMRNKMTKSWPQMTFWMTPRLCSRLHWEELRLRCQETLRVSERNWLFKLVTLNRQSPMGRPNYSLANETFDDSFMLILCHLLSVSQEKKD